MKNTFLVEIGTEELPPTQLKNIVSDFVIGLTESLNKNNIKFESVTSDLATPRRIAAIVHGISSTSENVIIEKKGPAKTACFDTDGNLSKAALGWLKSNNITIDDTTWLTTDKGEWLLYKAEVQGKKVEELLPIIVEQAIEKIQISKAMRWGNNDFCFIRPVHTFTMMLNSTVIPGEVFGIKSNSLIYGHRFQGEKLFELTDASLYENELLSKGGVIASFNKRLSTIKEQVQQIALKFNAHVKFEDDFLEEITSLVEKPNVLVANFSPDFLDVPKEALIGTMEGDQRYFPLFKDSSFTELLPHFIFVSNIAPEDPQLIIAGNEKVIRPRLTDAKFFFETDRKKPLIDNLPKLRSIVFQNQLGTVYDKVLRVKELSTFIAHKLNQIDVAKVEQAALLSKCDLLTNLVFEFPDTQGIMGRYYALLNGEDTEVAQAIYEQYLPRHASDILPETNIGAILSLADKIDTLVGIFGINQPPKGAKDPYALRRATIGIIRILTKLEFDIDLKELIEYSIKTYESKLTVNEEKLVSDIINFVQARYSSIYESDTITFDVLQAVLNRGIYSPLDFEKRLVAVSNFKASDFCLDLVAGFKRINNILIKEDRANFDQVDVSLFESDSETALYEAIESMKSELQTLYSNKEYTEVLFKLSKIRDVIFDYFDNVIVNHDSQIIKNNRLSTLHMLQQQFLLVADLTALVL